MKRSVKWIGSILVTASVALMTGCSSSGTTYVGTSVYSGYGYPHYGYYGGYYGGYYPPPPAHRPPPGHRPPGARPPKPTHPIARPPSKPNRPSIGRPSTRPSSGMRSMQRPSRGGGVRRR